MSFTEQSAEPVQPEGQGGEGTSDAPYAEYLNRIPEEVRGDVEPVFKDWDSNVTRRFQEHSEYRKTWEPYEQAGVTQYSPQDIQAAFRLLGSPQDARAWLDQNYGPIQAPAPEQPPDPFSGFEDPSQQQLEQLLESKLGPLNQGLEQLSQWREQFEQQRQVAEIQGQIDSEIKALHEQHGASLPEGVDLKDVVERYGAKYADAGADPKQVVARAWTDFQAHVSAIEKAVLQSKVNAPKPAESGGVPDVTPPQHKRVKDVAADAEDLLRQLNRQ